MTLRFRFIYEYMNIFVLKASSQKPPIIWHFSPKNLLWIFTQYGEKWMQECWQNMEKRIFTKYDQEIKPSKSSLMHCIYTSEMILMLDNKRKIGLKHVSINFRNNTTSWKRFVAINFRSSSTALKDQLLQHKTLKLLQPARRLDFKSSAQWLSRYLLWQSLFHKIPKTG